jgi:hypothetical protein
MTTGVPKPPRMVPESAIVVRRGSAQLMTADPAGWETAFTAKPSASGERHSGDDGRRQECWQRDRAAPNESRHASSFS